MVRIRINGFFKIGRQSAWPPYVRHADFCVVVLCRDRLYGRQATGCRAADAGDPYVPGRGNGGYDVSPLRLYDVRYDPSTYRLTGNASVITATATTRPVPRSTWTWPV